ncbi:MAG: FAD binding domain-containing protein [Chloroflexota bacterium]
MWQSYLIVQSVEELIDILAVDSSSTRIIAGGTDLILELERGLRPAINTLVDISRIPGLDRIWEDESGNVHIGPLATHNDCVGSALIRLKAFPLLQACWNVGSPQIRNSGTIAGNLITASPANDTITPLIALGANLVLKSKSGERRVKLSDFYQEVRKTVMQPDEFLSDIIFPGLKDEQRGCFIKSALRRAQAISVINLCAILTLEGDKVIKAEITLGAVAPTIIHATKAEEYLSDQQLTDETIEKAAELMADCASPISDIRGSDEYRTWIVRVVGRNVLKMIKQNNIDETVPNNPVLLSEVSNKKDKSSEVWDGKEIVTTINGKEYHFAHGLNQTLLRLIRDEAGLTGTKEGCGEGECGACTVYLEGKAVMSCLVPAPRAHSAEIVTIEGISQDQDMHPVQQAFINYGAVQCGFCTPGFVMSAVKLLEENPTPTQSEIKQAITGNLCRCTGYYKIVQAIEAAGAAMSVDKNIEA